MSVLYWRDPEKPKPKPKPPTNASYLGLAIFATSFFLPAVKDSGDNLSGLACALFAFFGLNGDTVNFLAVFGGLINPLAIAYVALRWLDRAPETRFFLALAILIFIPLSWLSLLMMHLRILLGHIAWISGLLLMIDWNDFRSKARNPSS